MAEDNKNNTTSVTATGGTVAEVLTTEIAAAAELAREAHAPSSMLVERGTHDAASFLVVPDRMRVHDLKAWLDARRPVPERLKGTATLTTIGSFVAHVLRFKDDATAVFACTQPRAPSLTAVYDYHLGPGCPRWGQHRSTYSFPLSRQWKAWTETAGKWMEQETFAAFFEEHVHEVADPSNPNIVDAVSKLAGLGLRVAGPSEVLTASRGITCTVETSVERHEVLATGEMRFVYDEKIKGQSGQALTVPGAFVVGVPVFDGDRVMSALPVRLRMRVKDGDVMWAFALLGDEDVVREAVEDSIARVNRETGLVVFEGSPEA